MTAVLNNSTTEFCTPKIRIPRSQPAAIAVITRVDHVAGQTARQKAFRVIPTNLKGIMTIGTISNIQTIVYEIATPRMPHRNPTTNEAT